jgi:uridine kinase
VSTARTIVGIAGGTASGKTTFAQALAARLADACSGLDVEVLSTDAYFLPGDRMPAFTSPSTGRQTPDFNRPDSIDAGRLVADLQARRQAGDGVTVVEGLMVLHLEAVRQCLDLRVFVELEADARALRRLVRNLTKQLSKAVGSDARAIADYYLESAAVGHVRYVEPSRVHADLILRGDAGVGRTAGLVAAAILGLRAGWGPATATALKP